MRNILTVKGSWSDTFREIYKEVDPTIEVVEIKEENQLGKEGIAVLLQGGADISPSIYKQPNRHARSMNPSRDRLEMMLLRKAVLEGLPILGICRGHQMLSACLGGDLFQDLEEDGVIIQDHPSMHKIEVYNETLDSYIPGNRVNSYHHQAVRRVPSQLKTAAMSLDGVIEAVYCSGVLGVQWHPEAMWEFDRRWTHLFDWHVRGLKSSQVCSENLKLPRKKTMIDLRRSSILDLATPQDSEYELESFFREIKNSRIRGYIMRDEDN